MEKGSISFQSAPPHTRDRLVSFRKRVSVSNGRGQSGGVTVRPLRTSDIASYTALIETDSGNLIHASPPFLRFIETVTTAKIQVLVAETEGSLVGAIPYASLVQPGVGRVVNSLAWYGSHGSCVLVRSDEKAACIRRALLEAFIAEIDGPDLLSATVILLPAEQTAASLYCEILSPIASDERIGQITTLPVPGPDLETRLERTFRQKTRNLVRKSRRQGFAECVTDDEWAWNFLWQSHTANIRALGGTPKPRAHFDALRAAIPASSRRLSVALDGSQPAAAMLLLFFGRTVEYLTPTIDANFRPRQPLSFLIWNAMLDSIASGRRLWNWGGTWIGQRELHHFKAGFGAVDHHYTYQVRASLQNIAKIRAHADELATIFPYFYVYPYDRLYDDERAAASQR